jgi:hypothetical protein
VLIRSWSGVLDRYVWPLADVHDVYECLRDGRDHSDELKSLCTSERINPTGWTLSFDTETTQIVGEDSFHIILQALRDATLVSVATVADFERLQELTPLPDAEQARARTRRDSRKHRCRAVAQVLWEKDSKATIPDLYRSEWIQRIACEGKPPSEKAFREWVKDLNPNRSPGRRVA